jgi:two-component system OmpR family response regulator
MDGQAQLAVLVADDDPALRLLCRVNLELEGYRVLEAASADEVAQVLEGGPVSLVILDVHLGLDDGLAVARGLRASHPGMPIVLFTGSAVRGEDWDEIADGYIGKPFSLEELSETVQSLAHR